MNNNLSVIIPMRPLVLSLAIASSLAGCSSLGSMIDGASGDGDFQKGVYASAGLGASRLTPSVKEFPALDVNDRVEPAGQVTIGADLTPTFSVEMHSADLGSAGFSPSAGADGSSSAGRYNYHMSGISALAYVGKNKHNASREGITAYGRLGLAAIDGSPVNDSLVYEREDGTPVVVGAGVEYGTRSGLGLRAEAMTNGSDASYGQVGVLYRLGIGSKKKPQLAQAKPVMPVRQVAPAQPVIAAAKVDLDGDRDGVMDSRDNCLSTPMGIAVDRNGCEAAASMIDMVLFDIDSAELTSNSRRILSQVAQQVAANPNAVLNLEGHADATGDAGYNMSLSNRRASNVAKFLVSQGVSKSQLVDINAYGETVPTQDNTTNTGRAANRRVELFGKGLAR